jgi:amino acid transporter
VTASAPPGSDEGPAQRRLPRRGLLRRSLVGRPISSDRLEDELLPKRLALPIFASDALSSVAYATEAALAVLVAASLAAREKIVPLSVGIAALMVIVVASYAQTIRAYPRGGGAYVVAKDNFGTTAGLVAAAALLVDYVLTVAVSIAAGALAITSAATTVAPYLLELSIAFLLLLLVANLRGLREAGLAFAAPTYVFIVAMFAMLIAGVTRGLVSGWPQAHVPDPGATGTAATIGIIVLLRAFASGCSALTGVEAIANGVSAFRRPQDRNAIQTLAIMGTVAVTLFLGVSVLAWKTDALPSGSVSVLSEVARASFGGGGAGSFGFYLVQISTFAVLVLAANTAFQGFPRLSAMIAEDGYAPRQLQNLGDRLVFSNGIILLSLLAGALLVLYKARVDQLIHLYLIGVFTAFTLSQAGMVRVWRRRLAEGESPRAVVPRLALNAVGALVTGVVAVVVVLTKFTEGAWIVTIAIPIIVAGFMGVRNHYRATAARLRVGADKLARGRDESGPVFLFVEDTDEATKLALAYGRAICKGELEAVHVPDGERRGRLTRDWGTFSGGAPLRELHFGEDPVDSLVDYLRFRRSARHRWRTVLIPEEFSSRSLVQAALRRRRTFSLKARLLREPEVVITDVPVVAGGDGNGLAPTRRDVEVIVPVSAVNDPTMRALDYAMSLRAGSVRAIHVALGEADPAGIEAEWEATGAAIPLEVIQSPFRDLGAPLLEVVRGITARPGAICNVVMPEAVLAKRRQRLLHNQRSSYLKRLLLFEPRTILTSVPYQLD